MQCASLTFPPRTVLWLCTHCAAAPLPLAMLATYTPFAVPCLSAHTVTPPGHFTTATATQPCVNGEYRTGWSPPDQAASCVKCSPDGSIQSMDADILIVLKLDGSETSINVKATVQSCCECAAATVVVAAAVCVCKVWADAAGRHVLAADVSFQPARPAESSPTLPLLPIPVWSRVCADIVGGQGTVFDAASNSYRAVNCDNNNFGTWVCAVVCAAGWEARGLVAER